MQPKLGLYSVSYAGLWYSGRPLTIKEFIDKAKLFKYDCVELDCRVPHAVPYYMSQKDRREIVDYLECASNILGQQLAKQRFFIIGHIPG